MSQETLRPSIENAEQENNTRPVIVTSVTLGKELHAGHIILLANADLLRSGLGIDDPIILVNNNTGPRAAGALVSLSREAGLSLVDTARLLDEGFIAPERIVDAYRGRIEEGEELEQALKLLDEGGYDIFRFIADNMQSKLQEVGIRVSVIPESANLAANQEIVERVNPVWGGTGFMFSGEKGIRVLQKGGQLTATGKCLVSLASLARPIAGSGEKPLLVFVDSSHDTVDAVVSYSSLGGELGRAMQLSAAVIGFEGKIASGSAGEAITIGQILEAFGEKCPSGSLNLALRHMVLTRPVIVPFIKAPNLGESIFDFKDNDNFISALVDCYNDAQEFESRVELLTQDLKSLVGDQTQSSDISDIRVSKWLSFLPMRTKSILQTRPELVIEAMRNVDKVLKYGDEIERAVKKQGYKGEEAQKKVGEYISGPKGLVLRDNYYLNLLRSIDAFKGKIASLTREDFELLKETIDFCTRRLGYAE